MNHLIVKLKFCFLFVLLIVLSNSVISEELCNSSEVKTIKQFEEAQDCLIIQLENINESFENIDEYVEYTTALTEEMIEERVLCEEYTLLEQPSPETLVSSGILEYCQEARIVRIQKNARVLNEMIKMRPKKEELKLLKKGIELELKVLNKLYPLFSSSLSPVERDCINEKASAIFDIDDKCSMNVEIYKKMESKLDSDNIESLINRGKRDPLLNPFVSETEEERKRLAAEKARVEEERKRLAAEQAKAEKGRSMAAEQAKAEERRNDKIDSNCASMLLKAKNYFNSHYENIHYEIRTIEMLNRLALRLNDCTPNEIKDYNLLHQRVINDTQELKIKSRDVLPNFPWPPPRASVIYEVPLHLSKQFTTYVENDANKRSLSALKPSLRHVDTALKNALNHAGQNELTYYAVPGGFALVSRLEQIEEDGTPMKSPERWKTKVDSLSVFSLDDYLKALFTAPPGYYRLIVFVVTPFSFSQSERRVSKDVAESWLGSGSNSLPDDLNAKLFGNDFNCTALIYEFEKRDIDKDFKSTIPGRLSATEHIKKSGIGEYLK